MSSDSDGSLWPGGRSPARIWSFSPATTRCASVVVIGGTLSRADRGALLGEGPHPVAEGESEAGPIG